MSVMTPEQFAAYMRNPIEYELGRAVRAGMTEAATAVKASANRSILSVAPRGLRTRKKGQRGKVSAFYNVYGHVNAFAVVAARGPLQIIEEATKAHIIAPSIGRATGRGGRARSASNKASRRTGYGLGQALGRRTGLMVTGGYLAGSMPVFVRHPGTQGQHPFARGVDAAEAGIVGRIERNLAKVGD